jgi:hypothetical protein
LTLIGINHINNITVPRTMMQQQRPIRTDQDRHHRIEDDYC